MKSLVVAVIALVAFSLTTWAAVSRREQLCAKSNLDSLSRWERGRGEGLEPPKPSPQPSSRGGGRQDRRRISLFRQGWRAPSQVVSGQSKVKVKHGKSVERDKSKPVRKAIDAWYARNIAAFNARDVAAIMALRTDDFHTRTPDGKVNSRADMEAYTRNLLGRIDHFISQEFQIGTIDVQGELAGADVTQKTVRMQRLPDGTMHKVEAGVVQRETWKRTAAGWLLYTVDNIRDGSLLVDDKPYKPASP